ncbi:LuxR C-terminal-related transcriptional regulator [Marinobacteraceae bacterium S3BR75-40.1]
MIRDDVDFLALTDAFYSAAVEGNGWQEALQALADASDSRSGQLLGIGHDWLLPFNVVTEPNSEALDVVEHAGGHDPAFNPRVAAGMAAPLLEVLTEADFITPEEHKTNIHYRELGWPFDYPFSCLASLERFNGLTVGLTILRSAKQGLPSAEQKAVVSATVPHIRAAVRMQLSLESRGEKLLTGAMEALSIAAFVCDHKGSVRSLSEEAEDLVSEGGALQLKLGCLTSRQHETARALHSAITQAALAPSAKHAPALNTIVIPPENLDQRPTVLDVMPLPARDFEFLFQPKVLVIARGLRRSHDQKLSILQLAYGLTKAESSIAVTLSQGFPIEAIATARGVSVGTVRVQVKTIMSKLGVSKQIELVALVNDL